MASYIGQDEQDINATKDKPTEQSHINVNPFKLSATIKKADCQSRSISGDSFFRIDPTYVPKKYNIEGKVLPFSQSQSKSTNNHDNPMPQPPVNVSLGNEILPTIIQNKCYKCHKCKRTLKSAGGLKNHLRTCISNEKSVHENTPLRIVTVNESNTMQNNTKINTLMEPIIWGKLSLSDLTQVTNSAYEEIIKWRKNLFLVPSGATGKKFISECTRLITSWNDRSPICNISMKLFMLMPSLLLQKPNKKSKTQDHIVCLQRRIELWNDGDFDCLIREGRAIQNHLLKNKILTVESLSRKFSNLMLAGKINAALKLLSVEENQGLLQLNADVLSDLKDKHPDAADPSAAMLLQGPINNVEKATFNILDADMIQKAALRTRGAAGPSNLDADGWRRILVSRNFGQYNTDLCKAIAKMARIMCTEECNIDNGRDMESFLSCKLIPLDKSPGIRPIGIGETLRRIIGKAVMSIAKSKLIETVGCLQTCTGQSAGCEAAIHAMKEIYDEDDTDCILLVDATNAFNSLNRNTLLHNIHINCPVIAMYTNNCYRFGARLIITGGSEIHSNEGTTQGDPIAMGIYAIGITPLIQAITTESVKHVAFADDLCGAGKIHNVKIWWDKVCYFGPLIGYHPNPQKSWLITKDKMLDKATSEFKNTGLNITKDGRKHLGSIIGTASYKDQFISEKINTWCK